ncbi:MAG TPA: ribosome maturation factor RimM [Actinomycetaceae bacterium]|nr:ribosome maturation factor RimM [Actinomycetaceae bacterium]
MELVVATVAGPHGLKGHVKLIVRTDDPRVRFRPGVILDTSSAEHPELTIADARSTADSWQLRFEEIKDREGAESLRGAELSIETEEWESEPDEWYIEELVGLPVTNTDGRSLGTVAAVETGPAQDLLVVATPGGEVRVPFVTTLVPEVSGEGVVVDPPGGLFDGEADE